MAVRQKKARKPIKKNEPLPTFDEAIALLFQLEPGDVKGFEGLSSALQSVVAGGTLDRKTSRLVEEAREQIDKFVSGEAVDAEDVLVETSRILDAASTAREASLLKKSATASVEPDDKNSAGIKEEGATRSVDKMTSSGDALTSQVPGEASFSPSELLPPDADPELLKEFVAESRELLEKSEAALLEMESNPDNDESVNTVFRAFHTVKGTSGFLGLDTTTELAHLAESLLSRIRNKEIRMVGGYADLSLRSLDMLKKVVGSVEDALHGALLEVPEGYADLKRILADPEAAGISEEISGGYDPEPDSMNQQEEHHDEELKPQSQKEARSSSGLPAAAKRNVEFESSIRVNTERLDRLIDMVGELVIAQSMVSQDKRLLDESCHELLRKVTHTGKIVRELQDLSMSMRMVPLRGTFQKMQRVARDLARKSGKSVNLVTDDGETEIDRHMVDILNDVLVHMVRNAIDHGIEMPEERERNGKNRVGAVRLTSFHSGGTVVVEIRDDGRGLNREKILKKAITTGLVDPETVMSDTEVYNLIFAPGFSTSEKITDVSGRGVGMDVVRKGIEALHGRVDINTASGAGSTLTVQLPLTLAITDGMLVRVGVERYVIPTISIHLCFRPAKDALSTITGKGEVVMLRGDLMPVFRLHRLFGIRSAVEDPAQGLLVVVGDEQRRCALLVDELLGQHQVVAKSLSRAVGKVPGVSGGAILGDGQVGLILDPREIVDQARQFSGHYGRPAA
jgi:two-component system, chemotaxis family, sensor kinase CheA